MKKATITDAYLSERGVVHLECENENASRFSVTPALHHLYALFQKYDKLDSELYVSLDAIVGSTFTEEELREL